MYYARHSSVGTPDLKNIDMPQSTVLPQCRHIRLVKSLTLLFKKISISTATIKTHVSGYRSETKTDVQQWTTQCS